MPVTTTTLQQDEIPGETRSAVARHYSLTAVPEMEADFRAAIPSKTPYAVGVSIALAPVGPHIETLALALQDQVFCLSLRQQPSPMQSGALQKLLSDIPYLTGFEMSYTIALLAHTLGSDVAGYDLSTVAISAEPRDLTTPGDFLYCMSLSVCARRVNERWDGGIRRNNSDSTGTPDPNHALRAWFTAIAANMALPKLRQLLSTRFVDRLMLRCFVDLATRAIRLDLVKPRIKENDFNKVQTTVDGLMNVENTRFKTRIRASKQTHLEVYLENGDVVDARIKGTQGRRSSARPERPFVGDISRIRVIGREERTYAEQAQYRFLFNSLMIARHVPLFVNIVWFPETNQAIECDEEIDLSCDYAYQILEPLNNSQKEVVAAMVSTAPCDSLVVAHGPPGTGKTTTITAAADLWAHHRLSCWIVAQSNVGVKNIAEKLFKNEVTFKLIVSKDFLFEWHEGLYQGIEKTLIRSDELPDTQREVSIIFHDTTIVLSTLTMLSNPKLEDCGLLHLIPVRFLVIDEASQIDIFDFMHLFYKFSKVLTKVCFFGDPKQLPPYGAEAADLQTIFDVEHLKGRAHFLDIQYRLPVPLGEFISKRVYNGKLRSCHEIVDYSCIAFVDVWKGEERKRGNSYENVEEVHMVVRIARRYHQRKLEFCIITFYDPQRAAITGALEAANLPSGCVYNVDSFQGNEADYVILSSVRTVQPGFLSSEPRMNVALTRCRKGMVVVTDKCFVQGAGRCTLLGQLCNAWSQHRDAWIDWKAILNGHGELPGLSLPSSPQPHCTLQVGPAVQASGPSSLQPSPGPIKIYGQPRLQPQRDPDRDAEFPSSQLSARWSHETRQTPKHTLVTRLDSTAEVARRGDGPLNMQAPKSTVQQLDSWRRNVAPGRPAPNATESWRSRMAPPILVSDSWRRPASVPIPAAPRDSTDAEFPSAFNSGNRSRSASRSAAHYPRAFRQKL